MSQEEKTFRINLPTLFERVNERRREQGMAEVEPAIMAVRASIKFAIRQQKHMDLKGEKVEMDESDAGALCQALGELFNVKLDVDDHHEAGADEATATPFPELTDSTPTLNAETEEEPSYVLPLFQFYASINRERRAKGLQPAEPAVVSVRTGIKFSIMRRRTLNFREDKLLLNKTDLRVLDAIIAQQFDVSVPGGMLNLCRTPAPAAQPAELPSAEPKGFLGRLLSRFAAKPEPSKPARHLEHHTHHYALDTSNLLLSIITRRAYLGHKPITPDKVKNRCGKALSAELELEVDMDEEKIALTPDQLDAFAEIIRQEFEIMFEDIDDLLGKKPSK